MQRHLLLLASLLITGCCSNVKVHKVPLSERWQGHDDKIEGFRYYLSRPYAIVKQPILIAQNAWLASNQDLEKLGITAPSRRISGRVTEGDLQLLRDAAGEQRRMEAMTDEFVEGVDVLADTVPSGAGVHLDVPQTAQSSDTHTAPLDGDIEIVFLPDLEEQYAIEDRNCLAKNAYRLHFRGGWELTDVGAEHDSTTVPIELLNTIDQAINAAKSIGLAGIDREAAILRQAGGIPLDKAGMDVVPERDEARMFQVIETTYIRPGVYRLNKPWEIDSVGLDPGFGVLEQLGLEIEVERRILPAKPTRLPENSFHLPQETP